MRREHGHAVVFTLVVLACLAAAALFVHEGGRLAAQKRRLIDAADAAALSAATFEARVLNFDSYMNRAIVANQAAMAQSVSLRSWLEYMTRTVSRVNRVAGFVPWLGAATTALSRVMSGVNRAEQPLLADDGHMLVDTTGHEIAASGLNVKARDLARLALLMLDENPSIPPAVRRSIFGGGDRALPAASRHAERAGGSYRSQWWVSHNPYDGISALGVYGQRVYLEPKSGLALVRFGSHPMASNAFTDTVHRNAIEALRHALF